MTDYNLRPREDEELQIYRANPFRRYDVDYTTVAWTNPVTGTEQVWSIPIEFLVTFFRPSIDTPVDLREEYERERYTWLRDAGETEEF